MLTQFLKGGDRQHPRGAHHQCASNMTRVFSSGRLAGDRCNLTAVPQSHGNTLCITLIAVRRVR